MNALFPPPALRRRVGRLVLAVLAGVMTSSVVRAATPLVVTFQPDGALRLTTLASDAAETLVALRPVVHAPGWTPVAPVPASEQTQPGARILTAEVNGTTVDVQVSCRPLTGGKALRYEIRAVPRADTRVEDVVALFDLPASRVVGRSILVDAQSVAFPAQRATQPVLALNENARDLRLSLPELGTMEVQVDPARKVLVQDDRQWADLFSVRVALPGGGAWKAGEVRDLVAILVFANGVRFRDALYLGVNIPALPPPPPAVTTTPPPAPAPAPAPMPAPAEPPPGYEVRAGAEWIPLLGETLDVAEGSALDFSGMPYRHEPAGIFGRVVVDPDTGHFVLADDPDQRPRRFMGVNICYDAVFLDGDEPERLAERLARLGYNAVRFHHFDGYYEWIGLDFTHPDRDRGVVPDPLRFAQFDRLFAACKARGLYVSIDLLASRKVAPRELWPADPGVENEAPVPLTTVIPVNEAAFRNWADFARHFLNHVNPHTGLRYADDPALAWIVPINEGNVANFLKEIVNDRPREKADWQRAWNAWLAWRLTRDPEVLARAGLEGDPRVGAVAFEFGPDSFFYHVETAETARKLALLREFLAETEAATFVRFHDVVRETGCRALLSNQNGWLHDPLSPVMRAEYDYVDDHSYIDLTDPVGVPRAYTHENPAATGNVAGRDAAWLRLAGKPFTLSEYNHSVPSRHRAFTGLATPALAGFQDWDGLWRFAYSHGRTDPESPSPLFALRPAGHSLDMLTDPVSMATERAALCLFARGDLPPAAASVLVRGSADDFRALNAAWVKPYLAAAAPGADSARQAFSARIAHLLDDPEADARANAFTAGAARSANAFRTDRRRVLPAFAHPTVLSPRESRELSAVPPKALPPFQLEVRSGRLQLESPRTQGGFVSAGDGAVLATGGTRWRVEEGGGGAAFWVSALDADGAPLVLARRILAGFATDALDDGTGFADDSRKSLVREGGLPRLLRAGAVELHLRRLPAAPALRAWALDAAGNRREEIPVERDDAGWARLRMAVGGPEGARLFYELAAD